MITQQVIRSSLARVFACHATWTYRPRNGEVTLLGSVQYVQQKGSAVQTASGVTGVRRVIDQMIVKPLVKRVGLDEKQVAGPRPHSCRGSGQYEGQTIGEVAGSTLRVIANRLSLVRSARRAEAIRQNLSVASMSGKQDKFDAARIARVLKS